MRIDIWKARILRYKRKFALFVVNHFLKGTRKFLFPLKRSLLSFAGYRIGKGTRIVGPLFITGEFRCGEDVWIGRNFSVDGNGTVVIGNSCDVAPNVQFYTGGHEVGDHSRRAGAGINTLISIGDGCWCCAASKFLPGASVGAGCVIAAGAVVAGKFESDLMIGGIPARVIKNY